MDEDTFQETLQALLYDDEEDISAAVFQHMAVAILMREDEGGSGGSLPGRSRNIDRNFDEGHKQIMQDYFWPVDSMRDDGSMQFGPVFSEAHFERRFSMPRSVFNIIFTKIVSTSSFFSIGLEADCTGKRGLSPLQKIVAAIRQLCYGLAADAVEEYVRIGESTALEAMKKFCESVVSDFGYIYSRRPTTPDLITIEKQFAAVGFPGCVGCLDCCGWQWRACPKALQGIFIGKDDKPTIRMEAICDLDLWIWHIFFGLPGMMNDINIMWMSPLMNDIMNGTFPPHPPSYTINGQSFNWYYFLTDGIYPKYKIFIQSLTVPSTEKEKLFCCLQEGVRKCIERVFGVLFKRFGILDTPGRLWKNDDMRFILQACTIIHNMVVEKRKGNYVGDGIGGLREDRIERENSGQFTNLTVQHGEESSVNVNALPSSRYDDPREHKRLSDALVEHLWRSKSLLSSRI